MSRILDTKITVGNQKAVVNHQPAVFSAKASLTCLLRFCIIRAKYKTKPAVAAMRIASKMILGRSVQSGNAVVSTKTLLIKTAAYRAVAVKTGFRRRSFG